MSRRLLWFLVLGAALSLVIVIAGSEADPIAHLLRRDFDTLLLKVATAVFVGGLLLATYRDKLSRAIEALLFWGVVALMLVVAYTYRGELREAGDRILAELIPGRATTHGHVVEILRGQAGDFPVSTRINKARIGMVLDTGASSVVLTHEAAKAAGLPLEVLSYSVNVDTANGRSSAEPFFHESIAVGGLTEDSVPAQVARPGHLKCNLLGMTFLNRLESWEVRGNKLLLRGYP
ncbi:MAG: TIGR02281 family clan AA aspartic protease [Xanthobacteraceae bacterium]